MCEPTPVITSPDFVSGSTSSIDPVTIQINTGEFTGDFTQSDIQITNGTGSEFSGSNSSYSIKISPTLADAVVTVFIPRRSYFTLSGPFPGNQNLDSNTFSWTYANPADVVAPTLSSSNPADDTTDVGINANIILNFNENVDVESGNITIKKTSDDSTS